MKISTFIAGILCAAALAYPAPASAYVPLPFEGRIINVDYNCLCSGAIMLTIQPTEATAAQGAVTQNMLFVYAAQLLEALGVDFSFFPIPRAYLWYRIFNAGSQRLLGNYVSGSFPCARYVGTACEIDSYATGAILNVGTSAF